MFNFNVEKYIPKPYLERLGLVFSLISGFVVFNLYYCVLMFFPMLLLTFASDSNSPSVYNTLHLILFGFVAIYFIGLIFPFSKVVKRWRIETGRSIPKQTAQLDELEN